MALRVTPFRLMSLLTSCMFLGIGYLPVHVTAQTREEQLANRVCSKATESVVTVKDKYGHGSGFIVSKDGIIVTNAHVVEDNPQVVTVIFSDGRKVSADVIGYAKGGVDLAILQVFNQPNLTPLPLAPNGAAKVGHNVFAIGTPLDPENQNICTSGTITKIDSKTGNITHNADTNPGNSGGPLVNSQGQVVGVNTLVRVAPVYSELTGEVIGHTPSGTGINLSQPVKFVRDILQARSQNNLSPNSTVAQEKTYPDIVSISMKNQVIRGRLEEGDRKLRNGVYADFYELKGEANQSLSIEMQSQDIDAYLQLYKAEIIETPEGQKIGISPIADNNDYTASKLDAKIVVTLPDTGVYLLIAHSLEKGEQGNYDLSITTNP